MFFVFAIVFNKKFMFYLSDFNNKEED